MKWYRLYKESSDSDFVIKDTDEEAKDFLEGAVDDLSIVKGGNAR